MLNQDYTSKLLNLEDVIITNVENVDDQLHIYIELPRDKHVCPACGAVTDRIHDYRMQVIKDVPLARDTFLHLRKRRYRCDCGKRFFARSCLSRLCLAHSRPKCTLQRGCMPANNHCSIGL